MSAVAVCSSACAASRTNPYCVRAAAEIASSGSLVYTGRRHHSALPPIAGGAARWAVWGGTRDVEGSIIKRKINFLLLGIPLVIFHTRLLAAVEEPLKGRLGERYDATVTIALMVVAALGLIPLAGFVESAVEELAELLGQFVGGLLHTTFGNVAELTIALSILLASVGAGGSALVLGSIAGVIIRNALLFLGLSTLLGCARNGRMRFDAENASEYSTVFALAVVGLCLPTIGSLIFGLKPGEARTPFEEHPLILLSVALAVLLLVSYLAYVCFAVFRIRQCYNLLEH